MLDVERHDNSYVGLWRRTSDPNDEGRFPGNPKAPLIVGWEGADEDEDAEEEEDYT